MKKFRVYALLVALGIMVSPTVKVDAAQYNTKSTTSTVIDYNFNADGPLEFSADGVHAGSGATSFTGTYNGSGSYKGSSSGDSYGDNGGGSSSGSFTEKGTIGANGSFSVDGTTSNFTGEAKMPTYKGRIVAVSTTTIDNPGPAVKVTEVYSLNNQITNCYYRPRLEDVPLLEETVLAEGFASAYTGFFDLNYADGYRPEMFVSKACEVLGYDYLLTDERYDKTAGYIASPVTRDVVPKAVALMDIYKAIGLSIFKMDIYTQPVSEAVLNNSPAIKNLPGYVTGIDTSQGKTAVFVTRSSITEYAKKAMKDLHMGADVALSYEPISVGDFLCLVVQLMDFYGEPVMSDAEMNQMLQVYGGSIPTALTTNEQQAYLYLKARGCLNEDLNWRGYIALEQMLNILMCVNDTDQRTDFKKIQVTMDINDELVNAGYFPKKVTIVDNEYALQSKVEYDYSTAGFYDYYIEIDNNTKFTTKDGMMINYITVPSIPNDEKSTMLQGAEYKGLEIVKDKAYYHLRIPVMNSNDPYMQTAAGLGFSNAIQLNSVDSTDSPENYWVPQGGGIYKYNASNPKLLSREPLKDGVFLTAVTAERKSKSETENRSKQSDSVVAGIANAIATFFAPTKVYAREVNNVGDITVKVTYSNTQAVANANEIGNVSGVTNVSQSTANGGSIFVSCNSPAAVNAANSVIQMNQSCIGTNRTFDAIATITSNAAESNAIMIDFKELVKAGMLYPPAAGTLPQPVNGVLTIYSQYGMIKLNDNTKQIVVGNTLYDLRESMRDNFLYYYDGNTLWVDFRAIYGWSVNLADMTFTGTGETYTVSVVPYTANTSINYDRLTRRKIVLPDTFSSGSDVNWAVCVSRLISPTGMFQLLPTASYDLANWVVYQGTHNGLPEDYCFVYIPKSIADMKGITDEQDMLTSIVGYSVQIEGCIVKVYQLKREANATPGQFDYNEVYGYAYNLPYENKDRSSERFEYNDYCNGDVILPVTFDYGKQRLINYNVNVFRLASQSTALDWGVRPSYDTGLKNDYTINVHGQKVKRTDPMISVKPPGVENDPDWNGQMIQSYSNDYIIEPAPAGVIAFFGGNPVEVIQGSEQLIKYSADKAENDQTSRFYFGTTRVILNRYQNSSDINMHAYYGAKLSGDVGVFIHTINDKAFFLTNISVWDTGQRMYSRVMLTPVSIAEQVVDEDLDDTRFELIDTERKDEWHGDSEFKLARLLEYIDYSTSWGIVFCLRVIPLLGITALTILLAFSMLADNKIVVSACSKFIDPVYLLTFGYKHIGELRLRQALIGLILGYTIFFLILDGNLLRVISWASKIITIGSQMLRQV